MLIAHHDALKACSVYRDSILNACVLQHKLCMCWLDRACAVHTNIPKKGFVMTCFYYMFRSIYDNDFVSI